MRWKGSQWEQAAESFLQRRGLRPVARNYASRCGEIDLVMLDGRTLVFIEVRYRRSPGHGSGAASVTFGKQRKITRTAQHFLQHHPRHRERSCRFDVVSIGGGEPARLDWIQQAFDAV